MNEAAELTRRRFFELASLIAAGTSTSFGAEVALQELGIPSDRVTVLRSKNPAGGSWPDVAKAALANPLGAPPLRSLNLRGKKIAVITDDWGRPTPASEIIPSVLNELHAAGAGDADITFITASGMHDPMKPADLERKLGKDTIARFKCISHDGGDHKMLKFWGITPLGTPIWINKYAAEADFRMAIGRIFPHETYGYEGGYKMIVPGVSSFETITRDHSMNFARTCVPGTHGNPSRREADSVGAIVGIHYLLNIVANSKAEPVRAFAGKVENVHPQGIQFGDREVWGALTPWKSEVTVMTLGPGEVLRESPPGESLRRAASITADNGTIICESTVEKVFVPEFGNETADDEILNSRDIASFNAMLPKLSLSELMRVHEMRNWKLDPRSIQHRIKAVRSAFYRYRNFEPLKDKHVLFTKNPTEKFKEIARTLPKDKMHVNILAGGQTTLPKLG